MFPIKKKEKEGPTYNFQDEDLCDLTMSSLSSATDSVSSMSTNSFNSTTDAELMIRAVAQLKSAAAASLSKEAHAELDQLVNRLVPKSPDTVTANLAEASTDQIEKLLGIEKDGSKYKLRSSASATGSISLSSRISIGDASHFTGYTDGTGTTHRHGNGINEILKRGEGKKSAKYVPRTISMSGSRSSRSSHSSYLEVEKRVGNISRIDSLSPSTTAGQGCLEEDSKEQSEGKSSGYNFFQSFFNCCSPHHIIEDEIPLSKQK